jgi:hypothetical protein
MGTKINEKRKEVLGGGLMTINSKAEAGPSSLCSSG